MAIAPFVLCIWLVLMLMPDIFAPLISIAQLPTLNAALNTLSAVLLFTGYFFIRAKNRNAHRRCMVARSPVQSLFLISYLIYHFKSALCRLKAKAGFGRSIS